MRYSEMIDDLPQVAFEDYLAGKVTLEQLFAFLSVLEKFNAELEEYFK